MAGWAFFMFATQMHERYLLPAIAFFYVAGAARGPASVLIALTSAIHLYSTYYHGGPLAPMIELLLLPSFFVALEWLAVDDEEHNTHPRRDDNPRIREFVYRAANHRRLWIAVLAIACVSGGLAVRGQFHALATELSLARLGAFRSNARFVTGNAARVADESFDSALVMTRDQPATFRLPPVFTRLRTGLAIRSGEKQQANDPCAGRFVVTTPQGELYRSNTRASADGIEWVDVPLPQLQPDITLRVEASGCEPTREFLWLRPTVVNVRETAHDQEALTLYLSDIRHLRSSFGLWKADVGIGGQPLRIAGVSYRKGLGVHANSTLAFEVPAPYRFFVTDIGYDADVPVGTDRILQFAIRVDDDERYRSPVMTPGQRISDVVIDVAGCRTLTLIVDALRSNDGAHADWGGARLVRDDQVNHGPAD